MTAAHRDSSTLERGIDEGCAYELERVEDTHLDRVNFKAPWL